MKTIKTTTGADIVLDGDILAIMEALYKEVTCAEGARTLLRGHDQGNQAPDRSDGRRDKTRLPAGEPVSHTVKYENDKLEAYMRKITK
jgi:hypothetical protein